MRVIFENAWVLYFFWVIPALSAWWIMLHKRSTRGLAAFVAPGLQRKLFPRQQVQRQLWQIGLAGTGLMLILVAVARPKWGEREETVYKRARDLVIAVDVSRSMLANDVHPSRLRRAKIDLIDLIDELNGDRAALIAFRAKPSLVCPLTTDYAFLRQALDGISPDSAPRGETDIGGAIAKALEAFDEEDPSHKAIILISDGEDLSGKAQEMAAKAGEQQIPIYTVGIGSREGARIPDKERRAQYLQHKNEDIVTKLDHETLYAIAKASGGSYIPVETASMTQTTLGTLYRDHLREINARELAETQEMRAIERYQYFLFPGLIFLLLACGLSRGQLARNPKPLTDDNANLNNMKSQPTRRTLKDLSPSKRQLKQIGVILLLGASIIGTLRADDTNTAERVEDEAIKMPVEETLPPGRRAARKAQGLYQRGKYREAAEAYLHASQGVSRQAARDFRHNAAVALAKAGDFEEAANIFRELSLQSRRNEADENLSLGSALYRAAEQSNPTNAVQAKKQAQLMRDAAEAFKEAWRGGNEALARDNTAISIQQLSAAEEQAKAMSLAEKYGKMPASQLADQMLDEQRKIARELPQAITNTSPDRIYQLEKLAAQQHELADMWAPLKGKLSEAMSQQGNSSNAQHFAALTQLMDVTQEEMRSGAAKLRDLDSEGYRSARVAEQGTYHLWKTVAPFEPLLREDLRQQTNVLGMIQGTIAPDDYISTEDMQNEAAQLTELFQRRFEEAIPEEGTIQPTPEEPPAQGAAEPDQADEKQGISAEDRATILKLAEETIDVQKKAAEHIRKGDKAAAIDAQTAGINTLLSIRELLPKQKQQQQQQDQQNDQQQDQSQQQQQDQPQQNQQDQKPQEEPQEKKDPENQELKDVRDLLQKALEREREHEAEKRRRNASIPLPAFERDW